MTMVSKTFDEVLTFTRASTGTYFDANGVLQTAAVDEARFDHDPGTHDPLGILIEESRTNVITNNEDYNRLNGVDNVSDPIIEETGDLPPISGISSVARVKRRDDRSGFWYHYTSNTPVSQNNKNTLSFFFKPLSNVSHLGSETLSSGFFYFRYNISTGNITTGGNADSARVTPIGEGWYLAVVTSSEHPDTSDVISVVAESVDNTAGVKSEFLSIGYQLEHAPTPSSYIATGGSAVTRAADNLSRTLGDEYNSEEGEIKLTAKAPVGETLLTLGSQTIVSDLDDFKEYTLDYTTDPSATSLVFGNGTHKKLEYYPRDLP